MSVLAQNTVDDPNLAVWAFIGKQDDVAHPLYGWNSWQVGKLFYQVDRDLQWREERDEMFLSFQLDQRYDPDVMKGIHVNLQTSAQKSKRPDLCKPPHSSL